MASAKPLFSVIIPAYQEELVIAGTLAQFSPELKQRFGIEVIVSDGGSNDKTVEIAQSAADTVLTELEGRRQTIAMGRNAGADVARGEILVYLDADVLIEDIEQFFRRIPELFQESDILAVTCNVRVYKHEERTADKFFHGFYNNYFHLLNVIGIGMGRGECQILRKSAFDAIGRYDETIAAGEDFDLYNRLKKRGRVVFSRDLTVRESPRRFRKLGYLRVSALWFLNAMSVWLFHKSAVSEWKPVR